MDFIRAVLDFILRYLQKPTPVPPVIAPAEVAKTYPVLSWEKYPENRAWTKFVYELLDSELFPVFDKTSDVFRFHLSYNTLTRAQKIHVWAEMISQICWHESKWNYLARITETSMGLDPITGKQVASEGLMQLSYQDAKNYPELGIKFDWEHDKGLDLRNPNRTILNPYLNLEAGMRILARQIEKRGSIIVSEKPYWSVLDENGSNSKIKEITTVTKAIDAKVAPTPAPEPVGEPRWLQVARGEIGTLEVSGAKSNPRIVEYHKASGEGVADEIPWCASFVAWCLTKSGKSDTNSRWARSYVKYGVKLDKPKVGCIVVFWRGSPSAETGHVGFWLGEGALGVKVLGGNQGDQVCISHYPKSRVLAYRWPA